MPKKTVKAAVQQESVPAAQTVSEQTEQVKEQKKKVSVKKRELGPNTMVVVRNGFNGVLVYISPRTGERFVWESYGDELDMELQDLRSARTTQKVFFENNWFLIDDPEVIENLGVARYYENALTYEGINNIFEMTPSEIEEAVKNVSQGQKITLIYRAKQLIEDGVIDSIKMISALEKGLGVELIER